jgi:Domain of unknown function (DUF1857)
VRYEHLLQINDLEQPDLPVLERGQLWSGLLARAERPAVFDASVDGTPLIHRDGNALEREAVSLRPGTSIEIGIGAGTDFAGSALTIAIEEPRPRALFLRFTYELRGAAVPADEAERCAPRQAYYFANLELVRRTRALAPGVV